MLVDVVPTPYTNHPLQGRKKELVELNQDLVEEGRALVISCESTERMTCEARLALGRWANKIVPAQAGQGARTDLELRPTGQSLEEYANAIGISYETLRRYRDVAMQWGDDPTEGLTWSVVRRLAPRNDREQVIAAVFEKYGRVTEYTIQCYTTWLQEENKRREEMLQPQFTDEVIEGDEDWDESQQETEIEFVYDPVNPPININQPRKHGYSGPIRKLFAVVEHCRAAKAIFMEESIPSVDYANDEYFEEIMNAFDTIITEMMDYREQVVAKRVKAGLSPEVG